MYKLIMLAVLFVPSLSFASYIGEPGVDARTVNCVPQKQAIGAWSDAFHNSERQLELKASVLAVCNPCSCPVNGMASCYEYLAQSERDKADRQRRGQDLLNQALKYGICEWKD